MKIIEIAKRIDKSKSNEDWMDTSKVGEELEVQVPCMEQKRLKCYWVGNWRCTDTHVGYRMYFLDDVAVAFSSQTGRKSDEYFQWFSEDAAKSVRNYLLDLATEQGDGPRITICDVQEDIGEGFNVSYNAEVLNPENVSFEGEKVAIDQFLSQSPYGTDSLVKIRLSDGEVREVDVSQIDFGFHIR